MRCLFPSHFALPRLRIYLKTKRQELLRAVIISQSQITYVDRGWSMKLSAVLPLVAFGVALTGGAELERRLKARDGGR